MSAERFTLKGNGKLDNEKKMDPTLPEEETEVLEEETGRGGVVIENFDEDKEEDDELYERYVELMEQEEEEEEDIAAVAERITGERHSRVTTAAPLRVRTGEPKQVFAPIPEVPAELPEEMPDVPLGKKKKKSFSAAVAAVLALLLVLSAVVIGVSVAMNRDETPEVPDDVPGVGETVSVSPEEPNEPEVPDEPASEEIVPEETEPETGDIPPETVPEETPEEETPPEPEVPAEPEPEPEPEPVPQYNVTLDFYDRDDITATVTQMTLAEVYAAVGYTPRESDRPSVGLDYVISADAWITIAAAEYKNVSVKEAIPYGTEEIKVDTIPRGEKNYITYGENGEVTRTYTVEYINGQETNRTLAYEETTKWAVNEKYEIGVGGSFTNANGITYTYSYRRTVPATYYNLEGLTYLGTMADESVIAVDPNNIPLGTKVYVKNDTYDFGVRVAADTGPKVDEWQIDIWISPYNSQYASFAAVGYHNDMEIYYLD